MPTPKSEHLALEGENTKYCTKCHEVKRLDEFSPSSGGRKKRRNRCKLCHCAEKKLYYIEKGYEYRRSIDRKSWLHKGYGLTLDDYQRMWDAQGGLCAICHRPETLIQSPTGVASLLGVDHDHTTGEIRGLLCSACNRGIGLFDESVNSLRAAVDYLESYAR